MRIDYCPKCHKAGLKYENEQGEDPSGLTQAERFLAWCDDPQNYVSARGTKKWCPRCKEWVETENHPYIGMKARQ